MKRIFQNLKLISATITEHMNDDPALLYIQISRRLPNRLVQFLARVIHRSYARDSLAVPALLACHVTGDAEGLERRFARLLEAEVPDSRLGVAADIALVANRPGWADKLLGETAGTQRQAATRARRSWYMGDMQDAVLQIKGQNRSNRFQRERLESEIRVFRGWVPKLPETRTNLPAASKRPRVLHLLTNSLPHTSSGYAQRTHSVLMAQQNAGWEVRSVTRLGYPVQVGKWQAKDEDTIDGVRYQRLLPSRLAATIEGRLQQQSEKLLAIAQEFRPGVLQTTTHFTNAIVAKAVAESLGIPWVYEVRGQLEDTWASTRPAEAGESERYRLFQQRETEAMRSADLVVTLGQAMKQGMVLRGVPEDKILICPNAVGGEFLKEPGTPEEARQRLGLPVDGHNIGTVSSLVDYEGLDDLVTAFAFLAPERPELRLLIVGEGPARPMLEEQVRRLGLTSRVIFTGRVPREMTPLYHQALDVFVVPRKDLAVTRSVTPLKPVEALASARPVVASDLPALREIVDEGVCGSIVRPEAPDMLAAAIDRLLADETMRKEFGMQGREIIMKTRTWAANAELYIDQYRHLSEAIR